MTKIIALLQKAIGKATGHKYSGMTVKTPFINFSFAPAITLRLPY